jgi:thiamine-phosphate pyrophosphorylase
MDRHHALEIGETQPDYIFFGKLEGDIKPEAHSKNVALGEWWSAMIEIPAIVMGGIDPSSAVVVAEAGVEFVDPANAATIVARVNAELDEKAPRFAD